MTEWTCFYWSFQNKFGLGPKKKQLRRPFPLASAVDHAAAFALAVNAALVASQWQERT